MNRNKLSTLTGAQALTAGFVMATGLFCVGAFPVQAASLTDMQAQLEKAQAQLRLMQPSSVSLVNAVQTSPVRPTAPVAPIHPTCRITFDKKVYKVGDKMTVAYSTAGADKMEVYFEGVEGYGSTTGNKLDMSNSAAKRAGEFKNMPVVTAGAAGIIIRLTSSTGHTNECGRQVGVIDPVQNQNPAYARVSTQIQNLINRENKVVDNLERIQASLDKIRADIAKLQADLLTIPEIKIAKASSTTAVNKYEIADVESVVTTKNTVDDVVYTITLFSGIQKTIQVPAGATNSARNKLFRESGYSGSIVELLKNISSGTTS
jgi:hypothetical protein